MSNIKLESAQQPSSVSLDSYTDESGYEQPLMAHVTLAEFRNIICDNAINKYTIAELTKKLADTEKRLTEATVAHGKTQEELYTLKNDLNLLEDE